MKLKNVLLVVEDIERSIKFYHNLFGLDVVLNNEGTVILTEGLVLQEKMIWESAIQKEVISKNHATELYFEERNIEAFVKKLKSLSIVYVTPLMQYPWGQWVVRFYDPDGNLIEVRTPTNV